jgi:hypothetical protein
MAGSNLKRAELRVLSICIQPIAGDSNSTP